MALALSGPLFDKIVNNIQEAKARGARMNVLATEGERCLEEIVNKDDGDRLLWLPELPLRISPLIAVVPLQLLAYYIAVAHGCDVNQPRNLAKSVTVE